MQNVCSNGHKRKHALKYQEINTLGGLILHAYGLMEGRCHDWTLYVRSGVEDKLEGSNLSAGQRAFNIAISKVRVTEEWIFKEVKLYWMLVDFKRKMRIGESSSGSLYIAAMLLTNMRNCLYPNT
eukprot:IDg5862t1